MKRIAMLIVLAAACGSAQTVLAKLPPPTDAQKAKAEDTKARAAWADKVAAYQLCNAQDKVAAHYFSDMKARGKDVRPPAQAAACANPGAYTPPVAATPDPSTGEPPLKK